MSDIMGPGWYYAEGDPPGTQRYWDGSQWQGGPQAVSTPGQAGGYSSGVGQTYTESSQATLILALSIFALLCCNIASPVAWYMGRQELQSIDAGRRDPSSRGTAKAGMIIGIIGTVIFVLGVVGYAVLLSTRGINT